MPTYRIETTVAKDGTIVLRDLPISPGERVEILIRCVPKPTSQSRYPLRGTPLTYQRPTESVAEEEWEALQ